MPRLPLPIVCGYIPLARLLTKSLKAPTPAPTRSPTKIGSKEEQSTDIDSISDSTDNNNSNDEEEKNIKDKDKVIEEDIKSNETKKPISETTEESLKKSLGWT